MEKIDLLMHCPVKVIMLSFSHIKLIGRCMAMATLLDRNHVEAPALKVSKEPWKSVPVVISMPPGYLPDEDDPAWPSKSGQAD